MKKYILTSNNFQGTIELQYNADGRLAMIDLRNVLLTDQQLDWFVRRTPLIPDGMEAAFAKASSLTVVEEGIDISFEQFWNRYELKRNITDAKALWSKMLPQDRAICYYSLPAYERYLKRNSWLSKMYPDTYLRKKHYLDEWDKLK